MTFAAQSRNAESTLSENDPSPLECRSFSRRGFFAEMLGIGTAIMSGCNGAAVGTESPFKNFDGPWTRDGFEQLVARLQNEFIVEESQFNGGGLAILFADAHGSEFHAQNISNTEAICEQVKIGRLGIESIVDRPGTPVNEEFRAKLAAVLNANQGRSVQPYSREFPNGDNTPYIRYFSDKRFVAEGIEGTTISSEVDALGNYYFLTLSLLLERAASAKERQMAVGENGKVIPTLNVLLNIQEFIAQQDPHCLKIDINKLDELKQNGRIITYIGTNALSHLRSVADQYDAWLLLSRVTSEKHEQLATNIVNSMQRHNVNNSLTILGGGHMGLFLNNPNTRSLQECLRSLGVSYVVILPFEKSDPRWTTQVYGE